MAKSLYQDRIKSLAPEFDARHVEAFMRVEHGTLDALSPRQFDEEIWIACACIEEGGADMAESIAKSYGL